MLDLQPRHRTALQAVLRQHLPPNCDVWAFGSRVKGSAAEGSDLDLVVRSADGSALCLTGVKSALRESNLPFSVELLDWATIPEHFRQEIRTNYVMLDLSASSAS